MATVNIKITESKNQEIELTFNIREKKPEKFEDQNEDMDLPEIADLMQKVTKGGHQQ